MSSPLPSRSPISFRHPIRRTSTTTSRTRSSATLLTRAKKRAYDLQKHGLRVFMGLTPLQRVAVVALGVFTFVMGILSLIYHEAFFKWLTGFAKGWRNITGGWLILWFMTFFVAFPPLIGYSTCVMLGGFVYGFPNGYVSPSYVIC